MAKKYNGIISAFKAGAKMLKKHKWLTGSEIETKEEPMDEEVSLYSAKPKQIIGMCAIGAMKRGLYFDYKDQYKEKHGSLKGWDTPEMIQKVEDICMEAEAEFHRFMSKRKNRDKLGLDVDAPPMNWTVELFNDNVATDAKQVRKVLLAVAEARLERLKKKAESRRSI